MSNSSDTNDNGNDSFNHRPGLRAAGRHNVVCTEQELTECDTEPLERIGTIQGNCGYFFSFDAVDSGRVLAYSANVEELRQTLVAAAAAPHDTTTDVDNDDDDNDDTDRKPLRLSHWFPTPVCDTILALVVDMQKAQSQRTFHFESTLQLALSVSTCSADDYTTIGLEVEIVEALDPSAQFSSTLVHLGRLIDFYNTEEIANAACQSVYHFMQGAYDRGMVYQFHDDLSGEVTFEIQNKEATGGVSYKGLRFPASDIPLSSRQLYIQNGVRYIHDCSQDPIPIMLVPNSNNEETNATPNKTTTDIDLTQIRMRGVCPPHIAYLNNMGVKSSMSLAIVVEGELWGMLSFHAYQKPYKPSLHQRIACETISSMVSVRIESLMKKKQTQRIIRLGELLQSLQQDSSVIHYLYQCDTEFLQVLDIDVMVCRVSDPRESEGDEFFIGDTTLLPTIDFWQKMAYRPQRQLTVESTRKGLDKLGLNATSCPASGIVFFQEGRTMVMLGRGTRVRDVAWGGDPSEPKTRVNGQLHPRVAFQKVVEKARTESRAWSTHDIDVISVMRDRICEHAHQYAMGLLRENVQDTNEKYLSAMERARDNYEFFAHMSHELRTPFHGVMGCLNILDEGIDSMSPNDVRDVVDTAIVSGNHMINLLNEILEISKNKHLSHVVSKNCVIYQTLAFETIDAMKSLAASRNIDLKSSIIPNGKTKDVIVTDKTKTVQVVSNIVSNAIKFTDGSGSIDVTYRLVDDLRAAVGFLADSAETHSGIAFSMEEIDMITNIDEVMSKVVDHYEQEPDGKWMSVSISDTGCGMNPTELVEMFRPYTQASQGSNKSVQGTGLGLFICVSLCFQMGGFISCASTLSVGTVFHIGIPVGLASDNEQGKTEEEEIVQLQPIPMPGPILVADDNVVNVKILKRALTMELKRAGKEIPIITANGSELAVDLYKENRPSLCIIDYHMPGIDGMEATKQIRAFETDHDLNSSHIMIYSADVTDQANDLIMGSTDVDELMPKPPPRGFILNLVQRLTTQNQTTQKTGVPTT